MDQKSAKKEQKFYETNQLFNPEIDPKCKRKLPQNDPKTNKNSPKATENERKNL